MAKLFDHAPTVYDRQRVEISREQVDAALERVKQGTDYGATPARPDFDLHQYRQALGEAVQRRDFHPYGLCLQNHGFHWIPPLQALATALPGQAAPVIEGKWQHERLGLALTPQDVYSLFATPEDLDRWIKAEKVAHRLKLRGEAKPIVRAALADARRRT